MRAQISMEYLILIGLVFIAVIPLFYYAMTESGKNIQMNQANDIVNTLAKTADTVYALGPGSQKLVEITIPGGVESVTIVGNEISLKLRIFGGIADIYAETKANVTGTITTTSGIHHVTVKTLESGVVQFEE